MADYTPTGIIHNTSVDFTRRVISEPVHIVQGDKTLPQIEVELLADGQPYTIPSEASVAIRYRKPDGNAIVNNAASTSGNTATFTVTEQMSALPGEMSPQVMVTVSGGVAATGSFPLIIDKNSVEGAKDSESELLAFDKAINAVAIVDASVAAAKASEDAAAKSLTDTQTAGETAVQNIQAAQATATQAVTDAKTEALTAVKADKDAAAASAKASADSAMAAQGYAGKAASSATEAQGYADSALTAATNAAGYAGEAEYRLMINPETGHMALAHYKKEA